MLGRWVAYQGETAVCRIGMRWGFGKNATGNNLQFLGKLGITTADLHAPVAESRAGEEVIPAVTHVPVMLEEVTKLVKLQVEKLKQVKGSSPVFMVDCCVGTGGHALHLLKAIPELVIAGLDWDPNMIKSLDQRTKNLEFLTDAEGRRRLSLKQLNFSKISSQKRQDLFPDYATGTRALKPKVDILFADLGYNSGP